MKRFRRAGMVLLAAAMLCAVAPCTAYAEKKSDYDYDMDYFGDMWWDGFTACFDKLDDAKKYDVNIARNDHHLATVTTSKRSVDFKKYFTRDGDYTFRVRGIRGQNVGDWGDWSEIQGYYEGVLDKPSDTSHHSGGNGSGTSTGQWVLDGSGRWWFRFSDGTYPAGTWWQIDEKWYLFDLNGYMLTGWQMWNGQYYYLGTDGAMRTDTWTPDGYYVGGDGVWRR